MVESLKVNDFGDLVTSLRVNGVKNYVIHSSLLKFGFEMEDIPKVFGILQEILGKDAILAFPTFTLRKSQKPFDYRSTCDKTNGALSLYALQYNEGIRSKSLMHSYFLHSRAAKLTTPQDKVNLSFGVGSIFDYFLENDFQVLLLGCNFQQGATFVHHVESLAAVYYRKEIILEKELIDSAGLTHRLKYHYFARKSDDIKMNLFRFEREFCNSNLVRSVVFEKSESHSFSMEIASTFLMNKLNENPNYLLES